MRHEVTAAESAALLREADRILILTHQYPDGDTLGSAYALCRALRALGKQAQVVCADPIPEKYAYMTDMPEQTFEPGYICAVDVADPQLLGSLRPLAERVQLCIDHHGTHARYAEHLMLDADCAATAMMIYDVIRALGVTVTPAIAECIYTGIATDTGCFKYANTSAAAHRVAAELMEIGIRYEMINHVMFDMKSRARVELERLALESMRFYYGGRCAIMTITNEMTAAAQAGENDMEGLAPLPRQIQGVWVGVTMRQKADGSYKISVRTDSRADAAAICTRLGGGGHIRAAGCALEGTADGVIEKLLTAIAAAVPDMIGG